MNLDLSSAVESKILASIPNIHKTSTGYRFRCPVCGDSKKSSRKARCNYYNNTDSFYCFNCASSGNGIYLLSKICNTTYREMQKELFTSSNFTSSDLKTKRKRFQDKNLDILKINDKEHIKKQFSLLETALPDKAVSYIESRKLLSSPFIDENFKFYWSSKTSRLVIPWYYGKDIIYYQGRTLENNIQPKYIFPKNSKMLFFGLNSIDQYIPYIFITEGAFDSMFVKNGVATGSINFSNLQNMLFNKMFPSSEKILMLDNPFLDKSSKERILKMVKSICPYKFFIPPKGLRKYKDVNDAVIGEKNVSLYSNLEFLLENTYGPAKALSLLL